jgi:hypothetical protein
MALRGGRRMPRAPTAALHSGSWRRQYTAWLSATTVGVHCVPPGDHA